MTDSKPEVREKTAAEVWYDAHEYLESSYDRGYLAGRQSRDSEIAELVRVLKEARTWIETVLAKYSVPEPNEMKRDVRLTLTHKEAKLLEKALAKGVFEPLTPAQADAISEFTFNLHIGIEEAGYVDQ